MHPKRELFAPAKIVVTSASLSLWDPSEPSRNDFRLQSQSLGDSCTRVIPVFHVEYGRSAEQLKCLIPQCVFTI